MGPLCLIWKNFTYRCACVCLCVCARVCVVCVCVCVCVFFPCLGSTCRRLVTGKQMLGLWPYHQYPPYGFVSSNIIDKESVIIQVQYSETILYDAGNGSGLSLHTASRGFFCDYSLFLEYSTAGPRRTGGQPPSLDRSYFHVLQSMQSRVTVYTLVCCAW